MFKVNTKNALFGAWLCQVQAPEQSRTPSTLLSVGFFFSCHASKYRVFRRVQNKANCKHTQNTSRILRLVLWRMFRVKLVQSVLIQALTCSKAECEEQRRRGRERRAPDKSTKLRVRSVFLHQRNEWHNEATSLNVREPSVSPPEGFCG